MEAGPLLRVLSSSGRLRLDKPIASQIVFYGPGSDSKSYAVTPYWFGTTLIAITLPPEADMATFVRLIEIGHGVCALNIYERDGQINEITHVRIDLRFALIKTAQHP
ncbi:MAG: hypothetical protein LBI39_00565 [Puniceicoccales bacterium]|jgi:hypothetical protein|nr:hypothetical protein [Puniceicoccales bacterium]